MSPPPILLVTEDLLGGLLQDSLQAAGYPVQMILPEMVPAHPWPQQAVALIIGELRYPVGPHLQLLLHLRRHWNPPPPLLLLGARPPHDRTALDPGMAWMPTPIQQDAVVDLVRTMLRHHHLALARQEPSDDTGGS
jgi:DNA-binding response OmpR family regulator